MSAPGSEQAGPHLTVVVCAYTSERWENIRAAIASLRAQTVSMHQLILVIDHNPELLDASRAEFPDVLVVANTGAQGLSGARNTGVAAATGDVVAFLDDDAVADRGWAAALLAAYDDATVVGVGGGVLPAWEAPRPAWFPDEFLWVVGCSYTGQPTERAEVRNPIGANMSFLRSVFEKVGGFDPVMGRLGKDAAGCEETEFSIRARGSQPGARILLEPAAGCRHTVTPERVTRGYFRRRCRAEGRSKALVSSLTGADAALETERRYVRETLPRGIGRGLAAAARGDRAGLARAWTIVEGVALTGASYASRRVQQQMRARRAGPQLHAGTERSTGAAGSTSA